MIDKVLAKPFKNIHYNSKNSKHICIMPYGRNFRAAVARWCATDEGREKAWEKRNVFSRDLKTDSLLMTALELPTVNSSIPNFTLIT